MKNLNNTELKLSDILFILKKSIFKISFFVLIISLVSAYYSLKLPNIYSSSALIEIRDDDNSSTMNANYGNLASFAGISLSGNSRNMNAVVTETIKSRDFFRELLIKYPFLKKKLLAMQYYDLESKSESYNKDIYNTKTDEWIKGKEKTFIKTHQKFLSSLEIVKNRKNPFYKINFNHISPKFSKEIIEIIIYEANNSIKKTILNESISKSKYLENKIREIQISDINKIFSSLLEKEVQKQLLMNVREDYVISIIDSPLIPEDKLAPSRTFIVILSAFLSFTFALVIAVYIHLYNFKD